MAKFKVKGILLHEGIVYHSGDEVEINPKENNVDRLIELDAIEPVEKKSTKKAEENPGE
jgi:hypothetical protein